MNSEDSFPDIILSADVKELEFLLGDDEESKKKLFSSAHHQLTIFKSSLLSEYLSTYRRPRTISNEPVKKSTDWWDNTVPVLDDYRFRRKFRLTRGVFSEVVSSIKDHEVFRSDGPIPQIPVDKQLAVVCRRLASSSTCMDVASRFGISEGVIVKCTERVFTALRDKWKQKVVVWPTGPRREEVISGFQSMQGFPNCVGAIDGSLIPMGRPDTDPTSFQDRKSQYSLNLQAIVDHTGLFTSFYLGLPGGVHDAQVFKHSEFYKNLTRLYIRNDRDYIIGDAGYPNRPFLITPFRNANSTRKKMFNYKHSSTRMAVERAFGRFKQRFRILRRLPFSKLQNSFEAVEICIILHNIAELLNDVWDQDDEDNSDVDESEEAQATSSRKEARERLMQKRLENIREGRADHGSLENISQDIYHFNHINDPALKRAGDEKRIQLMNILGI